jgi:SAM-dependent methyltransferase
MATMERWKAAQAYERGFWEGISRDIDKASDPGVDFYEWRAGQLRDLLAEVGRPELAEGQADVLEIGNGPVGVIAYFPARSRVAVDPLEDFYAADPKLAARRDPGVRYLAGMGESLPVDAEAFDLAIIENCIDHVRDMDAVMAEIRRALRPGGLLYLTVNTRTPPGWAMHRLLSGLRIDPGHPHTVTRGRVRRLVERADFQVLRFDVGSFREAWLQDLTSGAPRAVLKGLLGVSEFVVTTVARKPA